VTPAGLPDGCAVDTVEVGRIERLLAATPDEDLGKLFSPREIADAGDGAGRAASLAARFAAKEACLKLFPRETALNVITAVDFAVARDDYGAPRIEVSPAAEVVLGRHRVAAIQVSLTHTPDTASAVALRVPATTRVPLAGRMLWRWLPYRRAVIVDNLRRVFGANVGDDEIERLAQAHYGHLWALVAEMVRYRFLTARQKQALVRVEGVPEFTRALDAGKGVLIVTGHFGNFEVATVAGIAQFPFVKGRIHFVRRPIKPKWLDAMVTRRFRDAGFGVVGKKGSLEQIVALLERGDAVVFPFDQHARRPDGIDVEFFGHAAGTFKSLAVIALATGAPVMPAAAWREPDGHHVLRFEPPLPPIHDDDVGVEIRRNTRAYNAALERAIVRHPEQWWWVHRRWKGAAPASR
jgi:KDO2-lipid IV(A) lauroyltransferase